MSALRRNLVSLLVAQMATWVAAIVTVTVVPYLLGEYEFGQIGFATAFVGFFLIILGLGTSPLMLREVAQNHSRIGPYVYNASLLKVVMSAVLSVAALVTARALGTTGDPFTLIAFGCIGMFTFSLGEVFGSALGGLEIIARPAFWSVVQVYVSAVLGVGVLLAGGGVLAYAFVLMLATSISVVATWLMVRRHVRGHRRLDFGIWKWFVLAGIPLTILSASNLVYGTIDIPILNYKAGVEQVGWYTLAQRWVGIPAFISTAVVGAYYPRFAAYAKSRPHDFAAQVNKALLVALVAAVPCAIGLGVTAHDLIDFIYRGKFTDSISVLQVLVFHIPLTVMDVILATALLAADRQNRYVIVAGLAAVINPLLCLWAIPWSLERWGNGALGAAIITVATEIFIMTGALLLRSPGVLDIRTVGRIARIVAAGAVMGVSVWAVNDLHLLVQVAIGIVVYGAGFLLFRPVSIDELRAVMPRRGGDDDAAADALAAQADPGPNP